MDNEFLSNTKMLLGISDNSKDDLLLFYIEDVKSAVLSYCRLEFVPTQLSGLIPQIVADVYRKTDRNITSLTEGDRKIDFYPSSKSVIDEYYQRLKPFRNLSGILPSNIQKEEN